MASAHRRSGVRGLPPPKRWVFRCLGSKRCSSAHNASETRKPVVTLFTGTRLCRLLLCAIRPLYQIRVIRIATKFQDSFRDRLAVALDHLDCAEIPLLFENDAGVWRAAYGRRAEQGVESVCGIS